MEWRTSMMAQIFTRNLFTWGTARQTRWSVADGNHGTNTATLGWDETTVFNLKGKKQKKTSTSHHQPKKKMVEESQLPPAAIEDPRSSRPGVAVQKEWTEEALELDETRGILRYSGSHFWTNFDVVSFTHAEAQVQDLFLALLQHIEMTH